MTGEAEILIEIPPSSEYLSFVRAVVASTALLDPTFADERVDDLRLVVSEAATNAVEAHQAVGTSAPVTIRCLGADDRIEVEVIDRGGGFDPDVIEPLPPAESPARLDHESGLGLSLMRLLADEADIRSSAHGTVVRLVVHPRRRP